MPVAEEQGEVEDDADDRGGIAVNGAVRHQFAVRRLDQRPAGEDENEGGQEGGTR